MDVTDLIPKGLGTYWCVFLGGAAVVGLSEFAYQGMPLWCEKLELESISPLDVTGSGSFLAWGVSLLFLLAAGVSLINFRLGRKYGDPRPRVAAWFWMAVALLFLSMDTQVAFRETFRDLMIAASGTSIYEDGAIWWLAVYAFILGVIGTRILLDMLTYLPSLGLFLLATACCVAGLCFQFELIPGVIEPIQIVMLYTGLKSMAVLFYFLAFTLFARRQVFRDPEIALRWFAKIWNQTPILQTVREMQAAGGQTPPQPQPAFSSPTEAQPIPSKPAPPTTASQSPAPPVSPISPPTPTTSQNPPQNPTGATNAAPTSGTASTISRPLVRKPTENVTFKDLSESKKDDDFDLSALR